MASSFLFSSLLFDVDSRKMSLLFIARFITYRKLFLSIHVRNLRAKKYHLYYDSVCTYDFCKIKCQMLMSVRCSAAFWFLAISLSFPVIHPFAFLRRLDILWESLRVYIIFPGLRRTFENCNTCPTCRRHGRVGKGLWKTLVLQRLSQWNRTALYGNKNAPCTRSAHPRAHYETRSKFVRETSKGSHARGRRK